MNQQEMPSEWLARKKAGLGRLQGNHRVPGSASLDRIEEMTGSLAAIDQETVKNQIICF